MGFLGFDWRARSLKKHAERVANKRAQSQDRWESMNALSEMKTSEAIGFLMVRFGFEVEPSIADQEEKEAAFGAIVESGDIAVEPVCAYLRKTDSVAWALKCLDKLVSAERVVTEILKILEGMDTEYERDPQKKIQLISALEERKDDRIVPALTRFLSDMNETVRFHTVTAILEQPNRDTAREALAECWSKEDSVRVRVRIAEGFVAQSWDVANWKDPIANKVPTGYSIDPSGKIRKSSK